MKRKVLIQKFCKEITGMKFHIHEGKCWATDCYDTIYCTDGMQDVGDAAFRLNFVQRCPIAECYSDFILSLLHELGHIMTSCKMIGDSTDKDFDTLDEYFATHDESAATNWAISFMMNKRNISFLDYYDSQYRKMQRKYLAKKVKKKG